MPWEARGWITYGDATVVFTNGYQPYGQDNGRPYCPSCPTNPQLKFTGKPVSRTTGLYYEYSRWYDPSTGRFISQDSDPGYRSDPQSLNPYTTDSGNKREIGGSSPTAENVCKHDSNS